MNQISLFGLKLRCRAVRIMCFFGICLWTMLFQDKAVADVAVFSGPSPAISWTMHISHKVGIEHLNKEPEFGFGRLYLKVLDAIYFNCESTKLYANHSAIFSNHLPTNVSKVKVLGFLREFIAYEPSGPEAVKSRGGAPDVIYVQSDNGEVPEGDLGHGGTSIGAGFWNGTVETCKFGIHDTYPREFHSDCGSRTEVSGFSGLSRRSGQADCETAENGGEYGDDDSPERINIVMKSMKGTGYLSDADTDYLGYGLLSFLACFAGFTAPYWRLVNGSWK